MPAFRATCDQPAQGAIGATSDRDARSAAYKAPQARACADPARPKAGLPRKRTCRVKRHYYLSHESINPTRIVPLGPALDFDMPHARDTLSL